METLHEKYAVIVPACLIAQGLQVERKKGEHWGYDFVNLLIKYNVDMIPLPCAESTFGGYSSGLKRVKRGVQRYEQLSGYPEHCMKLAKWSAEMIADMTKGGYRFLCILGVENSPSCAVSRIYSNKGTLKRAGIFYQLLEEQLELRGITIPTIGILRGRHRKAIERLEILLRQDLG